MSNHHNRHITDSANGVKSKIAESDILWLWVVGKIPPLGTILPLAQKGYKVEHFPANGSGRAFTC